MHQEVNVLLTLFHARSCVPGTHRVPRGTNAAAPGVATPAEETLREGGMVNAPEFW